MRERVCSVRDDSGIRPTNVIWNEVDRRYLASIDESVQAACERMDPRVKSRILIAYVEGVAGRDGWRGLLGSQLLWADGAPKK